MSSLSKALRVFGLALFVMLASASSWGGIVAKAETVATPETPAIPTTLRDPAKTPALATILKLGAKAYYLGQSGGLDGWLIVKDHDIQIVYTFNDAKYVFIGAMFSENGENMTAFQLRNFLSNNKEIAAAMASAGPNKEVAALIAQPSVPQTGLPQPADIAAAAPPNLAAYKEALAKIPAGERLLFDLRAARGVMLGSNNDAPEIMMVMDPNCPHCQATWQALRNIVFAMKLRVRLIPIGDPNSEDERAAAILLSSPDPLNAWDKYVVGDKAQLAGSPNSAAIAGVQANRLLVDNWKINMTPYLVYRDKSGKVKVVQGEPEKFSALLSDLP